MTSDGMLSCYTPFLLAIIRRRVADAASARKNASLLEDGLLGGAQLTSGDDDGAACAAAGENSSGRDSVSGGDGRCESTSASNLGDDGTRNSAAGPVTGRGARCSTTPAGKKGSSIASAAASEGGVGVVDLSCPRALCVEALWALSEYAVLSPELAAAEVLPLAEVLATDTLEHAQVPYFSAKTLGGAPTYFKSCSFFTALLDRLLPDTILS